jgi:hypothetical protein
VVQSDKQVFRKTELSARAYKLTDEIPGTASRQNYDMHLPISLVRASLNTVGAMRQRIFSDMNIQYRVQSDIPVFSLKDASDMSRN